MQNYLQAQLELLIAVSSDINGIMLNKVQEQGDMVDDLDSKIKQKLFERGTEILKNIICAKG